MNPRMMPHTQRLLEAEIARRRRERDAAPKRPTERVPITDQRRLLNVDPTRVLTGEVEIFDPRERLPR
jgi:hypothetical protein